MEGTGQLCSDSMITTFHGTDEDDYEDDDKFSTQPRRE